MRVFLICALFGLQFGFAFADSGEAPRATLWTKGTVRSAENFAKTWPGLRVLAGQTEAAQFKKSGYIPPHERNALFRRLGMEMALIKMDEFDKDVLVMAAREYTVRELKSEYPMLSELQLRRLKDAVRGRK